MDISVVIPLFNEEESLPELAAWIEKVVTDNQLTYEVIMIDDGSTDNSWEVIQNLSTHNSNIKGIKFQRNYGKSAALNEGFKAAQGQVIITMDADMQDSPDEIPGLRNLILEGGYDLVSGWKKKRYDNAFTKNLPSKLFNSAARRMSKIKLNDFNCGLKAYKYKVVKSIEVYGEMHRYVPVLAKWAGFRNIGEKVVEHRPRKYGVTKFGWSRFINGFLRNSLNRYEFVKNTNSENEYALKKRYTFIDLINSVRSSGLCPFKYAIKERYPDLRKTLESLPIMEMYSDEWIETHGRDFKFPPLSFSMNDASAFQKIMQSTWFNSVENVRPLVESLLVDLLKIFINSPRVTEDIVVYRGVKTNYYRPGPTTSRDFWSTSMSPDVSLSFASYLAKNVYFTVEEITIKKDVPCLFISQYSKVGPGEWEILLPPGINYFIENDLYLKKMPAILSSYENSDDESMQNDMSTPETYIKYMMDKRKPKWFVLVNEIRAESFDTEIAIVKKIFAEVEQRKALLDERRRMRHLGWVPEGRSVTRNRNRNQNRNKSRRRNTQRRKQRNEKWQSSDENN